MPYHDADPRKRAVAIGAVAAVHLALGYLLITGLVPSLIRQVSDPLALFDLRPVPPPPPEPPPEPPPREPASDRRKSGTAAPANLDARSTEIVAPTLPPPIPPPVAAAPVAGPDVAVDSGAAPLPGPGTGGGGIGAGIGSGGRGDGQGAGGGGSFARKISGRIYDRDYPKAAARAGIGGTVWVRYTVRTDGRASDCRVTRSSGNADLDAVTCRLVTKRFRYRPGTDAGGQAIMSSVEEDHTWVIEPGDDRYDE